MRSNPSAHEQGRPCPPCSVRRGTSRRDQGIVLDPTAFEMRLTPKAPFPENIIPGKPTPCCGAEPFNTCRHYALLNSQPFLPLSTKDPAMLTSRIEQLKKQFFTHVPAVCLEGALSKTHVFKETEGEPMIVRRAKLSNATAKPRPSPSSPANSSSAMPGASHGLSISARNCPTTGFTKNWTRWRTRRRPYAITEEQKCSSATRSIRTGRARPCAILERASPQAHPRHHLGGRRHRQRHQD